MKSFLFLMFFSPLILCSCRVIPPDPTRDPETVMESRSAVLSLGNRLLGAIRDNDFRTFSQCLKNGPAAQMTLQDFRTSRENMNAMFGKMVSFEFLTELRTPAVRNLIWKITFTKTGKDGREITRQTLFRLVTGNDEGRTVVISFGFV